ncbi:MAG: hypothetical protein HY067_08220 [Betaproteobacteria bacterium]|nr:hypothetical protein [Betaproteobacteria bacterium]
MKKNNGFVCFVAAGLCSLASVPGHAESGTVDIVLSATSNVYAVQMGDTTVTARGGNGTVTFIHSSGRPFVEGASATVQYAGFSKKTPSGLDLEADGVATFSPEDTLLLLFERRSGDPGTSDEGTLHLTGGSGRFAGVNGQCKYKMDDLPGTWNVTVAKCQWLYSFPYR